MYGLLLENLAAFIKIQWGEGKWESIRRHAGVDAPSFSVHHVYAETLIPRLARSAIQLLGVGEREFFEAMGVYFVEFMGQYGYDQVLSVLGRHMRDFLNGLDNLHEYLKFSYPRMRAPSFYCDNESMDGLVLHYRSKRRGFVHYAMGQIKQVAKHFYDTTCTIELLSEEMDGEMMHVKYQLKFDNRAFCQAQSLVTLIREEEQLPVKTSMLFELFPFCIVFGPEMVIKHTGHSLLNILKDLVGQGITETFDLVRPIIPFSYNTILERQNNIFELVTVAPIQDVEPLYGIEDEDDAGITLKLKGQMLHMEDWNMIMFLCTPQMQDLDSLLASGLYINDLSLHDCSRDLILAGTQQSVELKLALDQEQQKSHKLQESMKQLDAEMKRTDELLYQMIPKQVADRIRRGENPVDTCEVFDMVSILFSDVVTFTEICSRITPMQVVTMLNHMYSLFDQLTERNGVYKVETIGDAYMVVSGAPNADANHAERICDMAMDMIDASKGIKDPSNDAEHLRLRVGVHSGTVVAGVVGVKMPRYCLFGDCVNTSSRMESSCEAGRIQISEATKNLLPSTYEVEFRGEVAVKGKGQMNTFWLKGRRERIALSELQCNSFSWAAPQSGPNPLLERRQLSTFSSLEDVRAPSVDSTTTAATNNRKSGRGVSSGRSSAAKMLKEKSVAESDPPAPASDGHIPFFTHQPSLNNMNLNAARAAVTQSLMSNRAAADKAAEQLSRAETMPNVQFASNNASSPVGNNSKMGTLSRSGSASPLANLANAAEKALEKTMAEARSLASAAAATAAAQATATLAGAVRPESASAVLTPSSQTAEVTSPKPSTTNAVAPNPSKDPITEAVNPATVASTPTGPGAENQEQDALTKGSESNSVNNVSKAAGGQRASPDSLASTEPGSSRSRSSSVGEEVGKGKKARLLRRLREHKVALLTSDALAQMGCSGFTAKQKEVVSQVCNLL